MLAEIIGPDILIIIAVIALLFGGTQIPKLARSVGRAQSEFKKGLDEGSKDEPEPAPSSRAGAKAPAQVEVPPPPAAEATESTTAPVNPVEPPPGSTN